MSLDSTLPDEPVHSRTPLALFKRIVVFIQSSKLRKCRLVKRWGVLYNAVMKVKALKEFVDDVEFSICSPHAFSGI